MRYSILFQPAALRELAALQPPDRKRIAAAIESLADHPRPPGCTKLSGFTDVWRIRKGVFRVIYRVQDRELVVTVIRVGHRRDVYR